MHMRIIISTAAVAAAVIAASAAEAAVSPGTFTGQTSAKDPVGITVSGSRVTSAYFEGVHMTCTDKDEYDTLKGQYRMHANSKARIGSSRRFTVKKTTHGGASTFTVAGRFNSKGTGATGTLRIQQRFNIENYLDPKGTITCDSGKLKLTLTHR
jgi:opacity protein-like surface antigen